MQDLFETHRDSVLPIIPIIKKFVGDSGVILEPCYGNGAITNVLEEHGFTVINFDKFTMEVSTDFLADPVAECDLIVTNPPFSKKRQFIERCFELRIPFLMLLPIDTMFRAGIMPFFSKGIQVFILPKRSKFLNNGEWKNYGECVWFGKFSYDTHDCGLTYLNPTVVCDDDDDEEELV
jgi:hypothetical protein